MVSYTAQSTQQFGFALLGDLATNQTNACISPISICLCLQLALYGARGSTALEMLKVTGITAENRESLADDAEFLTNLLQTPPQDPTFKGPGASFKVALANSIWVHDKVRLDSKYASLIQAKYKAACTSLDFGNPQSLQTINSWVDQNTEHKIPSIINHLQPDNMLVLINCAYFKATWSQQFSPEQTAPRQFYLQNNNTIMVPTMFMDRAWLPYFQDETVQVAQLDYTDKRFSMYIIMPAKGSDLSTFVSKLTVDRWHSWMSKMQDHTGVFALPKFKLEYMIELSDSLRKLGMVDAFSGQADFFNILAPEPQLPPIFCIGGVIHKTFIDVDEQGTEAAAATEIGMWGAGVPKTPPPFQMVVDRPFVYAVCENTSGTILFLGTVVDPRS